MPNKKLGSTIETYSSSRYLGPRQAFMFRTLLVAFGTVYGIAHTYAEFVDEDETPPGTVPNDFCRRASIAFDMAAIKVLKEGKAEPKQCEHGKGLTDYCEPCGERVLLELHIRPLPSL